MSSDSSLTLVFPSASSVSNHEGVIKFLELVESGEISPVISEAYLAKILKLLETQGIPLPRKPDLNIYKWFFHLSRLENLEKCVRKSEKFNIEVVEKIFTTHLEFIIKQGFDVNKKLQSQDNTPLGSAARSKCPGLIGALINVGANVKYGSVYTDGRSSSPLYEVVHNPIQDESVDRQKLIDQCIEILVKNGCDPNTYKQNPQKPSERLTPLWYAAHFGEEVTVRSLVRAKADINFETNHLFGDSTPLQASVYEKNFANLATTKALVELGADLFIKNSAGYTAADIAKEQGQTEIACYLDKSMNDYRRKTHNTLKKHFLPALISIIMDYLFFSGSSSAKSNSSSSSGLTLKDRITVL